MKVQVKHLRTNRWVKVNGMVGRGYEENEIVRVRSQRARKNSGKGPIEYQFYISRSDFAKLMAVAPDKWRACF